MSTFWRMAALPVLWLPLAAAAVELVVRDTQGLPLGGAMVTRSFVEGHRADTSDNGYPGPGTLNLARPELTHFTNAPQGARRWREPTGWDRAAAPRRRRMTGPARGRDGSSAYTKGKKWSKGNSAAIG